MGDKLFIDILCELGFEVGPPSKQHEEMVAHSRKRAQRGYANRKLSYRETADKEVEKGIEDGFQLFTATLGEFSFTVRVREGIEQKSFPAGLPNVYNHIQITQAWLYGSIRSSSLTFYTSRNDSEIEFVHLINKNDVNDASSERYEGAELNNDEFLADVIRSLQGEHVGSLDNADEHRNMPSRIMLAVMIRKGLLEKINISRNADLAEHGLEGLGLNNTVLDVGDEAQNGDLEV